MGPVFISSWSNHSSIDIQNDQNKHMAPPSPFFALLVFVYFWATALGHLAFSIWLVTERTGPWGPYAFKQAVPGLAVLAALGLLVHLGRLYLSANAQRRVQMLLFWVTWLAACGAVDLWLTFTVNEYAHYPQYALLAWLMCKAWDPDLSKGLVPWIVLGATALGVLDELMQYLWITQSYSHYLDFNDFFVNLLAVLAGVQLYAGHRVPSRSERPFWAGWMVVALLVTALAVVALSGRVVQTPPDALVVPPGGLVCAQAPECTLYLQRTPDYFSSWQAAPRHGRHWVLSPFWGSLLLIGAGGVMLAFLRWRPRT